MDNNENVTSFNKRGRKKAKKQYFMLKEGVLSSLDGRPINDANRGCLHLILSIDGNVYISNDGKFHKDQIILINND